MTGPPKSSIGIRYGAMAPRPSEQVKLDAKDAEHFDADATAIDRLYLRDCLTESEAHRARQRLTNNIAKKVSL